MTFKAGTEDLRDSPALAVADLLDADGAELIGHDPAIPAGTPTAGPVRIVDDAYLAADNASALVVLTEWPQFGELNWSRLGEVMRRRVLVDTRNHVPPEPPRHAGFCTHRLGRPTS
jgi:UDPglucose 6-dehydrogenase